MRMKNRMLEEGGEKRTMRKMKIRQKIRQYLNRKGRRVCAAAVCTSLIMGNVASVANAALVLEAGVPGQNTATASDAQPATPSNASNKYEFAMTSQELYDALQAAISDENGNDAELAFEGEGAEIYAEFLEQDGTLYELKPELEENDKSFDLRIFINLEEIPIEAEYLVDGSEELLFLLTNKSHDSKSAVISVGDFQLEEIVVAPKTSAKSVESHSQVVELVPSAETGETPVSSLSHHEVDRMMETATPSNTEEPVSVATPSNTEDNNQTESDWYEAAQLDDGMAVGCIVTAEELGLDAIELIGEGELMTISSDEFISSTGDKVQVNVQVLKDVKLENTKLELSEYSMEGYPVTLEEDGEANAYNRMLAFDIDIVKEEKTDIPVEGPSLYLEEEKINPKGKMLVEMTVTPTQNLAPINSVTLLAGDDHIEEKQVGLDEENSENNNEKNATFAFETMGLASAPFVVTMASTYSGTRSVEEALLTVKKTFTGLEEKDLAIAQEKFKITLKGEDYTDSNGDPVEGETIELVIPDAENYIPGVVAEEYRWTLDQDDLGDVTLAQLLAGYSYTINEEGVYGEKDQLEARYEWEKPKEIGEDKRIQIEQLISAEEMKWHTSQKDADWPVDKNNILVINLNSNPDKRAIVWTKDELNPALYGGVLEMILLLQKNKEWVSGGNSEYAGCTIEDFEFLSGYSDSAEISGKTYTVVYDESSNTVKIPTNQNNMAWSGFYAEEKINRADFEITNKYKLKTRALTVKKIVESNMPEMGKKFKFTLNVVNGDPNASYNFTKSMPSGSGTIGSGGTFELVDGQTITFTNLPADKEVTIKEADYSTEGYIPSYSVDDGGNYTPGDEYTHGVPTNVEQVIFKNKRPVNPPTGIFTSNLPYLMMLAMAVIGMTGFTTSKRRVRKYRDVD